MESAVTAISRCFHTASVEMRHSRFVPVGDAQGDAHTLKAGIADTSHNARRRAYFSATSGSSGASVLDRSHRCPRGQSGLIYITLTDVAGGELSMSSRRRSSLFEPC